MIHPDPAIHLGRRCRRLYEACHTSAGLRGLALARGIDLYQELPGLQERGVYVETEDGIRGIFVRPRSPEHVHAHEVGEFLFRDNIAHGIDYDHPDFHLGDLHEASNRFADALCAPDLETPVPLWRVTRANSALPVRVRYCGRAGR